MRELPRTTYWVMYNHSVPPYRKEHTDPDTWPTSDVQHCGTQDLEVAREMVREFNEKYVSKKVHFSTWAGTFGRINKVWIEQEVRTVFVGRL